MYYFLIPYLPPSPKLSFTYPDVLNRNPTQNNLLTHTAHLLPPHPPTKAQPLTHTPHPSIHPSPILWLTLLTPYSSPSSPNPGPQPLTHTSHPFPPSTAQTTHPYTYTHIPHPLLPTQLVPYHVLPTNPTL